MIKQFLEEQGFELYDNKKDLEVSINSLDTENNEIIEDVIIIEYNTSIKEFLLELMKHCFKQGFFYGRDKSLKTINNVLEDIWFDVNPFKNQLK